MIKKTFSLVISALCVVFVAAGCSTSESEQKNAFRQNEEQLNVAVALNGNPLEQINDYLAAQKTEPVLYDPQKEYGSLWNSDLFNEDCFKLDIHLTEKEKKAAKILARSFEPHMARASIFMHYLLTTLKERNLPVELAALPLVESGFDPRAKSYAGAHGPWQFMRATGKSFGLEVNANYDEFYDFIRSTDASLTYLEHLYKELGHNWELALAGYNQGEFAVKKRIRRALANGVNPNELSPKTVELTSSARTYILRFRAYADILREPAKYGLEHPYIENRIAFKRVQVGGRVNSMCEVARLSGVKLSLLKHLNAGYLSDSLTTNRQRGVLIPVENVERLERALGISSSVAPKSKVMLSQVDSLQALVR